MGQRSYIPPPWAKRTANFFSGRVRATRLNAKPMSPAEFEHQFRALIAAHEQGTGNVGCLACERCERCSESTFLSGCTNVARSNYCSGCDDCTECSHCSGCTACLSCSHCETCDRCIASAYLVKCVGLSGCTYCFGCVGLSKKDFHILNQPCDRQTYFDTVAELRRAMRI